VLWQYLLWVWWRCSTANAVLPEVQPICMHDQHPATVSCMRSPPAIHAYTGPLLANKGHDFIPCCLLLVTLHLLLSPGPPGLGPPAAAAAAAAGGGGMPASVAKPTPSLPPGIGPDSNATTASPGSSPLHGDSRGAPPGLATGAGEGGFGGRGGFGGQQGGRGGRGVGRGMGQRGRGATGECLLQR
jgi:hypothetical protein